MHYKKEKHFSSKMFPKKFCNKPVYNDLGYTYFLKTQSISSKYSFSEVEIEMSGSLEKA